MPRSAQDLLLRPREYLLEELAQGLPELAESLRRGLDQGEIEAEVIDELIDLAAEGVCLMEQFEEAQAIIADTRREPRTEKRYEEACTHLGLGSSHKALRRRLRVLIYGSALNDRLPRSKVEDQGFERRDEIQALELVATHFGLKDAESARSVIDREGRRAFFAWARRNYPRDEPLGRVLDALDRLPRPGDPRFKQSGPKRSP